MTRVAAIDVAGVLAWLEMCATRLEEQAPSLNRLDAAIGDGDHGTNMDRGFRAVRERVLAAWAEGPMDQLCRDTGMALLSTVGGAAGPLYGTFFLRLGAATGPAHDLTGSELCAALAAGVDGVRQRGRAEPGDKTMLDALLPAVDAYGRALAGGAGAAEALAAAADAAEAGRNATIPLLARKGRASYLGERSRGHQDPGATSSASLIRALAETVAG